MRISWVVYKYKTKTFNQTIGDTMFKPTDEAVALADNKTEAVINKCNEINASWGVEQIGVWVWVTNTKFDEKESLKSLGMKWSGKKKAWYWANNLKKGRRINAKNLDTLRGMHGSEKVN
jgi:hypothetical protein